MGNKSVYKTPRNIGIGTNKKGKKLDGINLKQEIYNNKVGYFRVKKTEKEVTNIIFYVLLILVQYWTGCLEKFQTGPR